MAMAVPPSGRDGQFKIPASLTSDAGVACRVRSDGDVERRITRRYPTGGSARSRGAAAAGRSTCSGGAALSSPEQAAIRREAMQRAWGANLFKYVMPISEG